jgi:hypothetical protein
VGVEQHALGNLRLDSVIDIEELLDIITVDNVSWFLRVGGIELHLTVFLERDPRDASNTFLHYFREPGQEEVHELRDLNELTEAAFLRAVND